MPSPSASGPRRPGRPAWGPGAKAGNGGAAYGDLSSATGVNSTAIGPGATVEVEGGTAVGTGATATAANATAVGAGSIADEKNTVSVGSVINQRRITNVAAATAPTDAVNYGQLTSVSNGLSAEIGDTRNESRGGVAAALAASSLRFDDTPGKLSVAAAYGNYLGESSMAFGIGYAADTRFRFNATLAGSPSRGDIGGSFGASLTLN
jgi:autotransporter adhesin